MSKQRDIKISQQLCWHELKSVKNTFSFNAICIVRFLHSIYTIEDRLGMYIYALSFFFQFNFRLMFTTMSKQRPLNLQKIIQYWLQCVFLPMSSIQMHRGVFFFLNASTCEDCEIMFVHLVERILRSQRSQLKLLAASGRKNMCSLVSPQSCVLAAVTPSVKTV